eukprot:8292343-Pyramimonas_sp.AAC.1
MFKISGSTLGPSLKLRSLRPAETPRGTFPRLPRAPSRRACAREGRTPWMLEADKADDVGPDL